MRKLSSEKGWILTRAAFNRLLAGLNSDRTQAAYQYERLRRRLLAFFEGRGCLRSEECADETFNRVARIIDQGREPRHLEAAYFLGVARNILREYWRLHNKEGAELPSQLPADPPSEEEKSLRVREQCMEWCLQGLADSDRAFIISYYRGEKGEKIAARRTLCERLKISHGQMRKRAFTIRNQLKTCAGSCLQRMQPNRNRFEQNDSQVGRS